MPDKLRSVDRLLPLKPKVLHILLAVADGPRHGYSIMQEVAGADRRPGSPLARGVVRIAARAREDRFHRRVGSTGRPPTKTTSGVATSRSRRTASACWMPRCGASKRLSITPARAVRCERRLAHDESIGVPSAKTANDCSKTARARGRVPLVTTWFALLWDRVFVGARHDLAQALRALVRSPGSHARHLTPPRTRRRGDDHALRVCRRGAAATASVRSARSAGHDVRIERQPGSPARGRVAGQYRRLGRSQRCVRCDHRDADGLGHPPGRRRRHADRRGARHARFLRRVSSSTQARAHVRCGRIRRRDVNHVAAAVQRRTGHRAEPSPLADAWAPIRSSSAGPSTSKAATGT